MPLLDEEARKQGCASVLSSQEVQADTSNHELIIPMKLQLFHDGK